MIDGLPGAQIDIPLAGVCDYYLRYRSRNTLQYSAHVVSAAIVPMLTTYIDLVI